VNFVTVLESLSTDNRPQRKEAQASHCLTLCHPIHTPFGPLGSWFGPEVASELAISLSTYMTPAGRGRLQVRHGVVTGGRSPLPAATRGDRGVQHHRGAGQGGMSNPNPALTLTLTNPRRCPLLRGVTVAFSAAVAQGKVGCTQQRGYDQQLCFGT
jgi:hypothetical protein